MIKISVLNVNYQRLKKIEGVFLVKLFGSSSLYKSDVYIFGVNCNIILN